VAEELDCTRGTDGSYRWREYSRGEEAQYAANAIEIEGSTEPTLDQPHHKEGLARIADAKREGSPGIPVGEESGCGTRGYHGHRHWRTRPSPKRDENPGGDPRCGPEDSHVLCGGEKGKSQLRNQEIGNGDADSENEPARPQPRADTLPGVVGIAQLP
jgi:hypothetical protein